MPPRWLVILCRAVLLLAALVGLVAIEIAYWLFIPLLLAIIFVTFILVIAIDG